MKLEFKLRESVSTVPTIPIEFHIYERKERLLNLVAVKVFK